MPNYNSVNFDSTFNNNNKIWSIIALMVAILGLIPTGMNIAYSQTAVGNQTMATEEEEEYEEHEGEESLIVSQHIPLTGQLKNGDYIHLIDFTPFNTTAEDHSHIAMKVPCDNDGKPMVTIITGVAPNFTTLDVGNAINNGTLNGGNLDLSAEGTSCLYHSELPSGITDIALVNTSNQTLNFDGGGYSVAITAHATVSEEGGALPKHG
jgi:hypothetical protein